LVFTGANLNLLALTTFLQIDMWAGVCIWMHYYWFCCIISQESWKIELRLLIFLIVVWYAELLNELTLRERRLKTNFLAQFGLFLFFRSAKIVFCSIASSFSVSPPKVLCFSCLTFLLLEKKSIHCFISSTFPLFDAGKTQTLFSNKSSLDTLWSKNVTFSWNTSHLRTIFTNKLHNQFIEWMIMNWKSSKDN